MYLTKWKESVHNKPDQKKRQDSAKTQKMKLLTLDMKTKSGTVRSESGSSIYHVTTESCDCRDFKVRKLPCKHMYFLDAALEKEAQKSIGHQLANFAKSTGEEFKKSVNQQLSNAITPKGTGSEKPKAPEKPTNKYVELFLAVFLGWAGVHRFYKGQNASGLVWLFTFGLFFLGWGIDVLVLLIDIFVKKPGELTANTSTAPTAPIPAEVKPEPAAQLPEITEKKPETEQEQTLNPIEDKLSYDYVLWRYLTTDHSTVEATYDKRVYCCAEFNLLMKNIPSVGLLLRDDKVARKTDSPSPFVRSSTITNKTNTKNISNFVVIDVETTGFKADEDDIIEISAIKFNGFKPVEVLSTLLKPSKPIPADATAVNGITNEMVESSPTFSQVKKSIEAFIGDSPIVAHNAEFDIGFLHASGLDFSSKVKFFDTLSLSKKIIVDQNGNKLDSYKLSNVCAECNIHFDGAHRSTADAFATGLLFIEIIKRVFGTNSVLDIQQK